MKNHALLLLLLFGFNATATYAVTHLVPSQFSTIQSALNACSAGDTVWVDPGTYYEHIVWPEVKKIKLLSTGNKSNTFIDGSKNGTVITMNMPNSGIIENKTQIKGFTITHGQLVLSDASPVGNGAGIYLKNASPKFVNCNINKNYITGNITYDNLIGKGAGVYCDNSDASFYSCAIRSNRSKFLTEMYGSALYAIQSSITFSECDISKNQTKTEHIPGPPTGIVYGDGTIFYLDRSTIIDNRIHEESETYPSGMICALNGSFVSLTNILFADNRHDGASEIPPDGNALYLSMTDATLKHVTFANNDVAVGGTEGASIYAVNNAGFSIDVTNSILWNNASTHEIFTDGTASITVHYSDVKGGYTGTGNINQKPLFITNTSDDKHLQPTSPCAGAGTNLGVAVDLDGNPRPMPSNTNPDMGCYEVDQSQKLAASEINASNISLFPNPASDASVLKYSLPQSGFVRIDLLNETAQLIKTLEATFQSEGEHQLLLSTEEELTAGLYILSLQLNGKQAGLVKWVRN